MVAKDEAPKTTDKQEQDLAEGKVRSYFYPEHNISVVAKDKAEADQKLKDHLAKGKEE